MYTVVCFGDTNTWGYDNRSGDRLPYDERWTGMLAKELGADFRVIEEGLPGRATTEDPVESGKNAREQIGPCLESHAPIDVFVMMLGQHPDNTDSLQRTFDGSRRAGQSAQIVCFL